MSVSSSSLVPTSSRLVPGRGKSSSSLVPVYRDEETDELVEDQTHIKIKDELTWSAFMTSCTPTCRRPTGTTMAHCPTCHLTFGSVGGFDRHRRGGQCLNPTALAMAERDGVWRTPMSEADLERRRSAA